VILVGRSPRRLASAARRLMDSSHGHRGNGETEIAERLETKERGSLVVVASEKVSLLVGDVSSLARWVQDLEKEMVTTSIPRASSPPSLLSVII
jgi:hypothetical protein